MKRIKRREFLRASGGLAAGGGMVLLSGCSGIPLPWAAAPTQPAAIQTAATVLPTSPAAAPPERGGGTDFMPDVEIHLTASPRQVQILPGQPTNVWSYQGTLVKGETANLQPLANTYLGPVIRVRKGQKVRIRFTHELDEPSIIHWHGLLLPSRMDGHPRDAIQRGQTYVYDFEVANRAGTYWYHPHPDHFTASQVMRGLAGLFIITDDEEVAAGLPSGECDIPLVIQDRTFDANNQITYLQDESMPGMPGMDKLMGFLGEKILVNGQVTPLLPVATRAYRLRVLNGSNSRVYKLGWSHGAPLIVIATDGGLLEQPVERPYVMLGPGERVELWADFTQFPIGTEVTLQSLAFLGAEGDSLLEGGSAQPTAGPGMDHGGMNITGPTATPEMGHGSMPVMGETPAAEDSQQGGMDMGDYNPKLPNGAAFPILHVRVERQEPETISLPTKLSTIDRYSMEQAVNGQQPRRFGLTMRSSAWLINGRSFELEGVAEDEVVRLNTLEAWEFVNETNPKEAMEKMGMVHPMHIHGLQFQVIERQVLVPELQAGWDSVHEGYIDEGWKDTVLVMPGEKVRLLMRFEFPDLFLYHCHNLEHEDLGMMRNYRADP